MMFMVYVVSIVWDMVLLWTRSILHFFVPVRQNKYVVAEMALTAQAVYLTLNIIFNVYDNVSSNI